MHIVTSALRVQLAELADMNMVKVVNKCLSNFALKFNDVRRIM